MLLALGLWISGKFVSWQQRGKTKKQAGVQLVCIGDSHTFGVGTSAPYSYPKQLEKLLNSNNPGQKFSVTNLGEPGSGTKAQSEALRFFLETHRVDGVLWLTGRNNADVDIQPFRDKPPARPMPWFFPRIGRIGFFRRIVFPPMRKTPSAEIPGPSKLSRAYMDYLDFYLETVRSLCKTHGAKLILLSYYNSVDLAVKEFADTHRIPFFDFRNDFSLLKKKRAAALYTSPDGTHMNRFGYQFYSECLYEDMLLDQKRLGLHLGPLLKKMKSEDFYADPGETEEYVRFQQERVEGSKETWAYPFEQIQLGHIYDEIGRDESAKECYMEGLISSDYSDNSMLVSPAIAWYLKRGERFEALQLSNDILAKNPKNSTAKIYREILSRNLPGVLIDRLRGSMESID
ncbi:MAG: SGNH/GDSL hydrolase family protein [Candidatus Omnitrophota bacterium]